MGVPPLDKIKNTIFLPFQLRYMVRNEDPVPSWRSW
jgi:hypothetical protein